MILRGPFFPRHEANIMKNEGDTISARKSFLQDQPSNLNYLLSCRYSWMNGNTNNKKRIIELGARTGFSKLYINDKIILTDYNTQNDWIDDDVDALALPYEDSSIDVVIASHMIHHVATPAKLFREISRVLKPSGMFLINDVNTSLMMRVILRL